MLELFRSSLGSWFAKIFIGLLVASFALWGIADYSTSNSNNVAITVGKTKIDLEEYQFAFDRQVLIQSRRFGRRLTNDEARALGVDSIVIRQLISGAVLDESARKMNLGLSNNELASLIGADEAFQDSSGNFNRLIFDQTLSNAGLRSADYVTLQKNAAIRQQVAKAITSDVAPPSVFLDALEEHTTQARNVSYIVLTPDIIEEIAEPNEERLNAYFDENKPRYRAPEYRKIVYLAATAQGLAKPDTIADEDVRAEYEATLESYSQPAERQIEQILVNTEETKQKAEQAIASGADFDGIVTALGLEAGQQIIGTFTKNQVPDRLLADAAFELTSGSTSEILKGTFGDVIIRVTETKAEFIQPFEAVAASIRENLAQIDASDTILDVFDNVEDARANGKSLEEIAKNNPMLELAEVTLDSQANSVEGEPLTDLPVPGQLLQLAFDTEPSVETDPIRFTDAKNLEGYVWVDVREVNEARERTLDEVQERVVTDWKNNENARLLQETADKLVEQAKGGAELATLAATLTLEVREEKAITRASQSQGLAEAARIAAFEGGDGHITSAVGLDDSVIVLKAEVAQPDSSQENSLSEALRQQANDTIADDLFGQIVTRLRDDLQPRINQNAISRLQAPPAQGGHTR